MKNIKSYIYSLEAGIKKLDLLKLKKIEDIIFKKIKEDKKIFICGNGGAA
jgi:phosphoheptose isomerase